jgi:ligand-binding sensor domain-containing protein/signal transduction histidine kinase/DNA-binding response OmpR family regulator
MSNSRKPAHHFFSIRYLLYWFSAICLTATIAQAQHHFQFEQAQSSNTISHEVIQSIAQDADGYLWLGTLSGLNRYDGYSYRVYTYDHQKTGSLSNSYASKVFVDRKKNLWIGTRKGLNLYDPNQDNFRSYPYEAGRNRQECEVINDILEDRVGNIWVATWGGIQIFDPQRKRFIRSYRKGTRGQHLPDDAITALLEDDKGSVWIGSAVAGLTILKNGHFSYYRHSSTNAASIPSDIIRKLYQDRRKQVWVGTTKGLCRYDSATSAFVRYEFDQKQVSVNAILEDSQGILWVGTSTGLYYLDRHTNQFKLHPQSIELTTKERFGCTTLFESRDHILWVAQPDLKSFDAHKNQFVRYKHDPQTYPRFDINAIRYIHEDPLKRLLFATAAGISTLEPGALSLEISKHLSFNTLAYSCLLNDESGGYWVGTQDNGLVQLDRSGHVKAWYKHQTNDSTGLVSNTIQCLALEKKGSLWVGTDKGLSQLDLKTRQFKSFSPAQTMRSRYISTMVVDRSQKLWLGTTTGLYVYDLTNHSFLAYFSNRRNSHSLSENYIQTLFEDSKGRLWIGTDDGGLNLFEPRTRQFKVFDQQTGLASNKIMSLTEDHRGNLWLASGKYLSCFNPSTRQVYNHNVEQHEEYLVFLPNSVCRSQSGKLYFGTVKGVISFYPDSVQRNTTIPKVLITGFSLFNKPVQIGGPNSALPKHISHLSRITIEPGQSVFGFEFIGLSYSSADKNQYAYKMEGFDADWNYVGTQRSATYTNLPPGDYVFRVKAANNDGIWNQQGASLHVSILPAFWQTYWFKGGLCILIISLSLWLYTVRVRGIKRQKTLLEQEVRERTAQVVQQKEEILEKNHQLQLQKQEILNQAAQLHALDQMKLEFFTGVSHEFRTPLTLILGPIQSLIHNAPACQEILRKYQLIHRNADRLLRLINQLLTISQQEVTTLPIRPHQSDIICFIQSIVSSFEYLAEQRHIRFSWQASPARADVYFDHDKVEKILYNLLSNAFKYTDEGGAVSLIVAIQTQPKTSCNTLSIQVQDTGIGIPADQLSKIYDRFFQADNSRSLRKEGTGIGLSLVKMLVDLHGGTIHTTSEEGKGTQIDVCLPLTPQELNKFDILPDQSPIEEQNPLLLESMLADRELTKGPLRSAGLSNLQEAASDLPILLIVEDNGDIREYVKELFHATYRLEEAADGFDGLQKAQALIPDLIITDIMMPGLDGIELCRRVKLDSRTSHIPVVMLTARSDVKHEMEGLETGADAYVTKPFHADLLQTRVRKLIESRQQLRLLFEKSSELIPAKAVPSTVDETFLEKLNAIIEDNLSNADFGGEVLLKELGMSRTQLYRKIHAVTGQSVNLYIRSIRVKKAAQLLKTTEMTVAEITYEVGFVDRSFFSKCFRQQFGVSPKEYAGRNFTL